MSIFVAPQTWGDVFVKIMRFHYSVEPPSAELFSREYSEEELKRVGSFFKKNFDFEEGEVGSFLKSYFQYWLKILKK